MPSKLLILGGTSDARVIAEHLIGQGHDVTTSLAGVTSAPLLPPGQIRQGGFGGVTGLQHYLNSTQTQIIVDATHPFAVQISTHAVTAAQAMGLTLLRLDRPAWRSIPGDQWVPVNSVAEAVAILPLQARVFLAIGRKDIGPFLVRPDLSGVMRMIEAPSETVPGRWFLRLERPPNDIETEIALMRSHHITHLVCKNAGGPANHKLAAARALGISVVLVERPKKPIPKTGGVYASIEALVRAVAAANQQESLVLAR
jgi:precorrin-6A/cobalt-precorrin-6A reductase